jgi:quinol monooxygenase YgiN
VTLPSDPPTLTVIATMRARAGREEDLFVALKALIEPTTRDAGYVNYDLHRGVDDPALFAFYENWVDRDTHARHMQAPHLQAFAAGMDELLDGPLRVDLLERVA